MKITAPRKTINVTAFLRKLNCVGSAFNFVIDSLMNLLISDLKIFDIIKATIKAPNAINEYFTTGRANICSILVSFRM